MKPSDTLNQVGAAVEAGAVSGRAGFGAGDGDAAENEPTPARAISSDPLRLFALSAMVVIALIGIQQVLFPSHYETNDDACHAMVLAGAGFADSPDEHILTPNILLGLSLKFLYSICPPVPWYFLALLSSQVLALSSFQYLLLRVQGSVGFLSFIALFITAGLYFPISLQFTSTALITGLAGGLLIVDYARREGDAAGKTRGRPAVHATGPGGGKQRDLDGGRSGDVATAIPSDCSSSRRSCFVQLYCGSFLLVLAFLIRASSGLLAAVFSFGFLLLQPVSPKQRPAQYAFAALGITLVAALGLQTAHTWCFSADKDWAAFQETRPALQKIIDFAGVSHTSELRSATGWTENDLAMLRNFLYCDSVNFSPAKIQKAAELSTAARTDLSPDFFISEMRQIGSSPLVFPPLLVAAVALCFLDRRRFSRGRFVILAGSTAAAAAAMLVFMKLPPRVYFPLISLVAFVALYYIDVHAVVRVVRRAWGSVALRFVVVTAAIVLVAMVLDVEYKYLLRPARKIARAGEQMEEVIRALAQRANGPLVAFAYAFPYELIPPQSDLRSLFRQVDLIPVGGYNNSPLALRRLEKLGVQDLLRDLESKHLALISNDYLNSFYGRFMEEHHGLRVRFVTVAEYPEVGLRVFKVDPVAGNGLPSRRGN